MTAHLHAMAVTTGWTVAVIFGVLLLVLAGSGWGTAGGPAGSPCGSGAEMV